MSFIRRIKIMKKLFISLLVIALSTTASYAKRTKTKYIDYVVRSGDSLFAIAKNHHTTTIKIRNYNGLAPEELIRVGQSLRIPTNKYISSADLKKQIKKKTTKTKISKRNSKSKSPVEYKVQSGDTLFSIARKHHTTTTEILEKNGLDRDSIIKVGLVLNVPRYTYFPDTDSTPSKKSQSSKVTNKKIAKKSTKKTVSKKTISSKSKSDKKQIKSTTVKRGKQKYTIEKGDTLYSIAQKHHTTTKEVMDANGMEKGALIRVGQIIKVPTNTYFTDEKIIKDVLAKQEEKARIARGIHKVKSGDTLFSIAMKNHVSLKDIMKYNKLKVNSVLKIGQELKVTKKASYVTARKSTKKRKTTKTKLVTKKYKIRSGDTLSKIAKRYKISVKKLRALNGLSKKSKLRIGKTLVVGKRVVKPKKKRKYIVKRGDTVWLIAKKNNTTVKEIRKLNNLTRKSKIKVGMVLAIAPQNKKSSKSRKSTRLASKSKNSKGRRNSALSALNGKSSRAGNRNSRVIRTAKRYLGKRYVWGAVGPNKFDCSGFTQYVIRKSKGVKLPRVSRKQAYYGKYVSRSNLRPGDLIFFDTSRRRRGYVNHVGIYIGGNKFIHASSAKHRVVITSLNRPFYKARFKWGRRVN